MSIDLSQFDKMTKGPWRLSLPNDCLVIDAHGYEIAEAKGLYETEWETMETNALAIASLPDLIAELKRTREALEIAREYLDNHSNCVDGDYGVPAPNDAMKCLQEINEAMEKR